MSSPRSKIENGFGLVGAGVKQWFAERRKKADDPFENRYGVSTDEALDYIAKYGYEGAWEAYEDLVRCAYDTDLYVEMLNRWFETVKMWQSDREG